MRVRRCYFLTLAPCERTDFDLLGFVEGGSGLSRRMEWLAVVPHAATSFAVSAGEAAALGEISPSEWTELAALEEQHDRGLLDGLVAKGLLVAEDSEDAVRDERVRETHWRPESAALHYASRWHGVDADTMQRELGERYGAALLEKLGPVPPAVRERVPVDRRLRLPGARATPLDALLHARVTCRNFDATCALGLDEFAAVLYRAFGARAVDDYAPGVQLLKKGVPSAGGLHPTEAYLLVQRVDGIAPGLYHYHAIDHALEPIRLPSAGEIAAHARTFVGSQPYFLDAPVFVIPVTRFRRNFWKYRNHAKAYRALVLDVGHLSQTLYLAATELGLAAFITAAINEVDIETAFGLDPLEEGPLAVCGFGRRAAARREVELDPLHAVWPAA
ncbi:MAG TPA: putative peptide maturation dehydrogenase [Rhodanobacteraceae bacterium]|nr:putative peptide maturation dehydrogenase [Rhodanobacteraceae bacterium]